MGWMTLPAHRFTALVAMLAVFGAHVACVCHLAAAAPITHPAPSASGKPSHACCKHANHKPADSRPQPAKSPGEGCRHCAGLVSAARPATDSAAGVPTLQAPVLAVALIEPTSLLPQAAHPLLTADAPPPHSNSLLRLHCALNL